MSHPMNADQPVELEQQFVLRLPEEPAAALREALRSGASNVANRLKIRLEPEENGYLRRGEVGFDGWVSIEDGEDGLDQMRDSVTFLRGKIGGQASEGGQAS